MALGLPVQVRTVLVEGTTDAELFQLASRIEREKTGIDLMAGGLAILAAGMGDLGGTRGVLRELTCLRGMARTCLLPNGRPRYRFVGLFDNDKAGKQAVRAAHEFDSSVLEYKDVFRLWPVMPEPGNLDPGSMQKAFETANAPYKGLDWELEDLLPPTFMEAFVADHPGAVGRTVRLQGKTHRDLTRDGKARLHRFIKQNAVHDDILEVIQLMKRLRFYLGVK
jgi:hypothetical protein